jgi:stage V sporulation protein AA
MNPIYLLMRKRLSVQPKAVITLGDICQLYWDGEREEEVRSLPVFQVKPSDGDLVIIDIMQVIRLLRSRFPEVPVEVQGPPQIIVEVRSARQKPRPVLVAFVWVLLFIGSGLAIMNFHTDVSMVEVHKKLHVLVTGQKTEHPLWLQIPYSIGIGLGMILFFNHLFKKRFNEEPSPLEVELFLYQQNLDQYYIHHENKENEKVKQ